MSHKPAKLLTSALFKKSLNEFVGTFLLVFIGCGAIIVHEQTGVIGHLGIALSFGLTVMIVIAATGHISGAHLNPAVSIAFAFSGKFPWGEVPFYAASQTSGAILAALLLKELFGPVASLGSTQPYGSDSQSFILEILLTSILMFIIITVANNQKTAPTTAAVLIGATVGLSALWAGPISGASMNPARSLGPALVSGTWNGQWIYWVGPVLGACLGVLIFRLIQSPKPD